MDDHPLRVLEDSVQIAWDYLELTGQIDDPEFTGRFLLDGVTNMVRQGERRRLLLSNRAISAYQRHKSSLAA